MQQNAVLLPGESGTWLDVDFESVARLLEAIGIRCESLGLDVQALLADAQVPSESLLDPAFDCPDYLRYYVSLVTTEHWQDIGNELRASYIHGYRKVFGEQVDRMRDKLRDRFDCAVIVQGFEPTNAVVREAAVRDGLSVLSLENTMLSDRLLWDCVSGVTPNRNLAANYFWRYSDFVERETVSAFNEDLIQRTRDRKSIQHAAPSDATTGEILSRLSGRPYCLFLGQVYTDSSLVFGLANWRNPLECLWRTYQWTARTGLDLVVKLHPKEVHGLAPGTLQAYDRMTWRKMQESNLFVDFLKDQRVAVDSENNWDTYELIESAHCVATINSQSGLEAAIRGKPVIVLGEAFYSRLGFTNDWGHPALLDILGCEDLKIDLNKARRFAYIFLEKYCVGKAPEDVANLIERSSKWRL